MRARALQWVENLPERTRRLTLRVVAGAAVLGLAAVVGLGWTVYRDSAARADAEAALAAARTGTEQLLSISAHTLDADLARAAGVVTEPFATQFRTTATNVIAPATRDRQLATRSTAVRVAIIGFHADQATALVYLDQTTSAGQPGPPERTTSQVRETLTKVGGRWLISGFEVL